jgi:PPOX class probable F420-dependent enzyme
MDLDAARSFIRENPRAVMVTRRASGEPQLSPVLSALDEDGRLLVSSRETAFKVKNLRRDPRVSFCFLDEGFFGEWIQVDGQAAIVSLPEAMDLLIAYYRLLSGEHPDWNEYRAAMEKEQRVVVRVALERAGPDRSG